MYFHSLAIIIQQTLWENVSLRATFETETQFYAGEFYKQ